MAVPALAGLDLLDPGNRLVAAAALAVFLVARVVASDGRGHNEGGESEDDDRLDGNHFDCVVVGKKIPEKKV